MLLNLWMTGQRIWIEEERDYAHETASWLPERRLEYAYEGERLKSITWSSCNLDDTVFTVTRQEVYQYLPDGKLRRATGKSPGQGDTLRRVDQMDYFYWPGGGMARRESREFDRENGALQQLNVAYFNAISGKRDSVLQTAFRADGIPEHELKRVFAHEGLLSMGAVYTYQEGEWVAVGATESEWDEAGHLIRTWTNISDYMDEEEFRFEYDEYNNRVRETYRVDPNGSYEEGLRLYSQNTIDYQYDDGRIQSASLTATYYHLHNGEVDWKIQSLKTYDYYCDGVLKAVNDFREDGYLRGQRRYFYHDGTHCDRRATHELDVKAYPNPTHGLLTIESASLLRADSEVRLFDISGRLVKSLPAHRRIDYQQMDLRDLPAGIYILRLSAGQGAATVRIVKD